MWDFSMHEECRYFLARFEGSAQQSSLKQSQRICENSQLQWLHLSIKKSLVNYEMWRLVITKRNKVNAIVTCVNIFWLIAMRIVQLIKLFCLLRSLSKGMCSLVIDYLVRGNSHLYAATWVSNFIFKKIFTCGRLLFKEFVSRLLRDWQLAITSLNASSFSLGSVFRLHKLSERERNDK